MKVKVEIKGLTELKKKKLEADMLHTKYIIMDEMVSTCKKLQENRGIKFKIIRLLSKVSALGNLTLEAFTAGLETASTMDANLFDYEIKNDGDNTILTISLDDIYFDMLKMVPMLGGIMGKIMQGKAQFMKKVEVSIRSDYSDNFTIEEI
jgi:hypothetical protein